MKNQLFILSFLLFFSTILHSCCSPCRASSPVIGELESGSWKLIEVNLNPVEESEIFVTFNAEEKTISGTAPCNSFFASYTLFNARGLERNIEFKNGGATMRMCPDSEQEEAFVRVLPSVYRVKLEGKSLLMIDSQERLVAVLVKVE